MEDIHTKYINSNITVEELQKLRELANEQADADIEQVMQTNWMENTNDTFVSPIHLQNIKAKIDSSIKTNKKSRLPIRIFTVAAAILLPILSVLVAFLFKENRLLTAENIVISTGMGEYVNIVLPDGTSVTVNAESDLEYFPLSFNKDRKVNFKGEAYFDVVKNSAVPFIVSTSGLNIKVLGTKFNLWAREDDDNVEVYLENGHIVLISNFNQKTMELFTNQKVVFNKKSGDFIVVQDDLKRTTAWKRKELRFKDVTLNEVLKIVKRAYNITITVQNYNFESTDDLFSGTLPADDLEEALTILLKSYNFKYILLGDEVIFSHAE